MATDSRVIAFPGGRGNASTRRLVPSRLRDARVAKRLRQQELSEMVGVSRQSISAYELGEKAPEADTLARITVSLGQPLSFFTSDDLPTFGVLATRFYRAFGTETRRRNEACEVYSRWLAQTVKYFAERVNFPAVNVPLFEPASRDGRYEPDEMEDAADQCRAAWGLGFGPISNVLSLAENKGIAACRLLIEDERVNAFSFWNGPRPFVFLANETESSARARFDVAHEIGHIVLHKYVEQSEVEDPKNLKLIETEANYFAGALLLPRKSFPNEVFTTRLDSFVALKQRWKVSIQAMIYRCKTLGIFDDYQITNLYKQVSARRWRTVEPFDDPKLMPIEEPKLLRAAASLVLKANARSPAEVCADVRLSPRTLEMLCGLDAETLTPPRDEEVALTLR